MFGAVRQGENFVVVFLLTDKPDQYLDSFEAIIRSIYITDQPLSEVTDEPQPTSVVDTAIIVVTGTAPASVTQGENGVTINYVTATPSATPFSAGVPTLVPIYPTASPFNIGPTALPVYPAASTPLGQTLVAPQPVLAVTPVYAETVQPTLVTIVLPTLSSNCHAYADNRRSGVQL